MNPVQSAKNGVVWNTYVEQDLHFSFPIVIRNNDTISTPKKFGQLLRERTQSVDFLDFLRSGFPGPTLLSGTELGIPVEFKPVKLPAAHVVF